MNTKKCSKCKEVKQVSDFSKDKGQKSGYACRCKECSTQVSKESYYKHREKRIEAGKKWREKAGKEYFQEKHLNNTYGITSDDRKRLLIEQNHKCAICGIDEIEAHKNKLFVDHNHETNKVRALLCHNCNTLIGHCKESEDILLKSIQYLRKHKE